MNDYRYPVVFTDDPDGGVIATFPDVPEAITFGSDENDAASAAAEALGLALRGYLAKGRALPLPNAAGTPQVAPHLEDILKLALVTRARSEDIGAETLSRRLNIKAWKAEALLDADAVNTAVELEDALRSLGTKMHLVIEAA